MALSSPWYRTLSVPTHSAGIVQDGVAFTPSHDNSRVGSCRGHGHTSSQG